MIEPARLALRRAAIAFRDWADAFPAAARSAEWECDYEDWDAVWAACETFLEAGDPGAWNPDDCADLLYLLARDNETETIRQMLAEQPARLLALAAPGLCPPKPEAHLQVPEPEARLQMPEPEARWQLADALGDAAGPREDIESLLVAYCGDADEYVARRALLALARRAAPQTETMARLAWDSGREYPRIVALRVLWDLRSPLFAPCRAKAIKDGPPGLARAARALPDF